MTDESVVDPFDGEVLDVVVPESLEGMRVDRAIAMLTGLARSECHSLVEGGAVSVSDRVVTKSSTTLTAGQRLVAVLAPALDGSVAADTSVAVDVVIEDPDFVVVNKAPGVVVHPGAGQRDGTLIAGLLARYPGIADLASDPLGDPLRPGIVHRLDKGTSGLLVVARTVTGLHSLSEQLSQRTMERVYLGLVDGHVIEERGIVDAPARSTECSRGSTSPTP